MNQNETVKLYSAYNAVVCQDYISAIRDCKELIATSSNDILKLQARKLLDYISRIDNVFTYIECLRKTESRVIFDSDIYASISELIFFNNLNFADEFISTIIVEGLASRTDASINTVKRILHSAKNVIDKIEKKVISENAERIVLKDRFPVGRVGSISEISANWGLYDYYENYATSNSISYFSSDFSHESEFKFNLLKSKGFAINVRTDSLSRIFYGEDVRICALEADMYAIFDKNHTYSKAAAGRLAKIVPINVAMTPSRRIRKAIFLPVPHAIDNYYHVLSEMIYSLRYVSMVDKSIPIIYSEDRLKLLPFFSQRLNIDLSRFVSFEQMKNCSVDEALIIDKGSHYWDADFYNFFNWSINGGRACAGEGNWIYISRSRSARSFAGELELEKYLIERGVKIIHSQEMSVADQIKTFETASLVIAPHGAGITNILFTDRRTKLLEIFNKNFINPDFYLRSRQQRTKYAAIILGDDNGISLDEFQVAFNRLLAA